MNKSILYNCINLLCSCIFLTIALFFFSYGLLALSGIMKDQSTINSIAVFALFIISSMGFTGFSIAIFRVLKTHT